MATALRKLFGANLKAFRKANSLTQAKLAEKIDRSSYLVSQIERGENAPSFETIEDICRVLKIPAQSLFKGSDLLRTNKTTKFAKLQSQLATLSEDDLDWVENVLQAVLNK